MFCCSTFRTSILIHTAGRSSLDEPASRPNAELLFPLERLFDPMCWQKKKNTHEVVRFFKLRSQLRCGEFVHRLNDFHIDGATRSPQVFWPQSSCDCADANCQMKICHHMSASAHTACEQQEREAQFLFGNFSYAVVCVLIGYAGAKCSRNVTIFPIKLNCRALVCVRVFKPECVPVLRQRRTEKRKSQNNKRFQKKKSKASNETTIKHTHTKTQKHNCTNSICAHLFYVSFCIRHRWCHQW